MDIGTSILPSKRINDLKGKRFGKLVVMSFVKLNKDRKAIWLCKCDCGKETFVSSGHLHNNFRGTKSCGCLVERKDLVGKQFNRLTVLSFIKMGKFRQSIWLCKCVCGNVIEVSGTALIVNHTKSCGCLQKERAREVTWFTHKGSRTKLYKIWKHIKQRCDNPNCKSYKNYGGRGIIYNISWSKYENFKRDMIIKYISSIKKYGKAGLSIERKDVNGNYCFDNCIFIPHFQQGSNTRKNRWFKAFSPDGRQFISKNQVWFARDNELLDTGINRCLRDRGKTHKGWTFEYCDKMTEPLFMNVA